MTSGSGGLFCWWCRLLVDGWLAGVSCSSLQYSGWGLGLPEAVFAEEGVEQAGQAAHDGDIATLWGLPRVSRRS